MSGNVHIDGTDIHVGSTDHFLVRMELNWAAKTYTYKKKKGIIRKWHLDRFGDNVVKLRYVPKCIKG